MPPLQVLPRCNPGRSPTPHNLQCGSGLRHLPLGGGGSGYVDGIGGPRRVSAGPFGVF